MKSMTGHGRGTVAAHGVQVVVECFSVNRKQGEVSVTVPREMLCGWSRRCASRY